MTKKKAEPQARSNTSIQNCKFVGVQIDSNATEVAKEVARGITKIAESNQACAEALKQLASRFATAEFKSMVTVDGASHTTIANTLFKK